MMTLRSPSLSLYAFCLARLVHAALYTETDKLPRSDYDFVIVGAGTAGNVLANRLSDNQAFSVLVIEAGGSDTDILNTTIPYIASETSLANSTLFWNYTTTPQTALNERRILYPRGRGLGGSSTINLMFYTRGSRDDFDRYAKVTGDNSWSWDSVFPFMLKAERLLQPVDEHNTTGEFNPSAHGHHGPLLTTLPGFPSAIDPRILATTQDDPVRFPFNLDYNAGDTIGFSWIQTTSGGGQRSSSATAYLHPALNRTNLDVLINNQVTRLLPVVERAQTPDLRVVEFAQIRTGPRSTVRARKEVILSAGPVNTPQLLQLSGIGEPDALSAVGIKTLVSSPGVGQNLQDHPLLANQWLVNSNTTLDDISRNATLFGALLEQWETNRTGQFAAVVGNLLAFLRVPPDSSVFNASVVDPSAGPTSGHFEIVPANQFLSFTEPQPANGSFLSTVVGMVSPLSRGSTKITSSDPFDFPVIDPAFFTHPLDIYLLLQAFAAADAILATQAWEGYVIERFGAFANATTDEALIVYARNSTSTFWHTCCTAKMGRMEDETAVVDSLLRLKGAKGVRVVDASIFPFIPAAHTQAPVYAIAERAAQLIQAAWTS